MIFYLYALMANFFFGLGSQFFAQTSKNISPVWATVFRNFFYLFLFFAAAMLSGGLGAVGARQAALFMLSGFIALGFGDIFLMKAFGEIGPGRTMMLYAFQPIIVGALSFLLFGQTMSGWKFLSIIFFISCVFIFSLESRSSGGGWNLRPVLSAFLGISIDAVGIIISRTAFNMADAPAAAGNFYRGAGSVLAAVIMCYIFKVRFWRKLKNAPGRSILAMTWGCVFGGASLLFYLAAVKGGHLATLSAISITTVIFASFFECLFGRKWPSKYWTAAFMFFLAGMAVLLGLGN